jgi:prepilin-type N-terminal cleavage/methylation domain-containing protein
MKRSGVTLIEVMIAVSLLSLLSLGILMSLRVGMGAMDRTNRRLINNRKVAGSQRILEQQLAGFIPVVALAAPSGALIKVPFFEGRERSMRFVSSYSLSEASRGIPQVVEFQVIPGEEGRGVRLVVNETVYTGPRSAGVFCLGLGQDAELGVSTQRFPPISIGPSSFVLADRLAYCRFSFLGVFPEKNLEQWLPNWIYAKWPAGIRIEMASLDTDLVSLKPVTVTVPFRVNRDPTLEYADEEP